MCRLSPKCGRKAGGSQTTNSKVNAAWGNAKRDVPPPTSLCASPSWAAKRAEY